MKSIETRYGHVFVDGEDHYLFVKVLGIGMEASAQLVVHVQTGDLVVRKVEKRLLDEWETEKQDPERILFLVQSQARLRGVQPNTAHLLSADDVPAPQKRGGQKLLYHRVKYFKFYNGGNLGDLRDACQTRSLAPPPSMICKMVQQVVHALNFMYAMKPYIIHGDAHIDNIFLHWDQNVPEEPEFFLGDFGWSTCGKIRAGNKYGLTVDVFQLWMHTRELLDIGTKASSQSALRQYLEAVIESELRRLAHGPASLLPNLSPLLELLSAAPAAPPPPDMRPFLITRESHSPPSPLLYDTWEEAQKAHGIHGPWHVAQVSIDPSLGKLNIVRLSPSTYHRPTPPSPDDMNSDSDGEWVEVTTPPEDWTLIEHTNSPFCDPGIMAETCCGRRAARATVESINQSLEDLGDSIRSPGSGEGGLEQDPNCACDPCMCPSDDVPCNARYLGNDLTDQGLRQALQKLVRHARQIQGAQGDACDCADRPRLPSPIEEPSEVSVREPVGFFSLPEEVRHRIYALWVADLRVLPRISPVRMRLTEGYERTRLSLNYPTNPPERHIMDHLWDQTEDVFFDSQPWEREVAAITYEPSAEDNEMRTLPDERLALLRVSRAMHEEAGRVFYGLPFRFSHPRDIIRADHGIYHGILAAEAFFNDRTDANLNQFSEIDINLAPVEHYELVDTRMDYFGRNRVMRTFQVDRRLNWTDGLESLGRLGDRLRPMPFQRLHLHFEGTADWWHDFRITDPRQEQDRFGNLIYPWTVGLFNIGPRNRLQLTLGFAYGLTLGENQERRKAMIYRAVHWLSVIRQYLLTNARALGLEYEGIRVLTNFDRPEIDPSRTGYARVVANRGVLIECDDEYIPESNEIRSRLGPLDAELLELVRYNYMATEDPPPVIPPSPPRGERKRVRPPRQQEAPPAQEQEEEEQERQRRGRPPPGEEE